MMKREWFARFLLATSLGLAVLVVGTGWYRQKQVMTLRARMPEGGGWLPGEFKAVVGSPLKLRLVSDDVTHSFAVGKLDIPPVDIHPGEVSETTLNFDVPGKYIYYCTRWCGPNHWRMRGTIEVSGDGSSKIAENAENEVPLYLELGLDIDAPHPTQFIPKTKPLPTESRELLDRIPLEYLDQSYYRTHSPAAVWEELRSKSFAQELSDVEVWSLVAAIWQSNTDDGRLDEGEALYSQNCAACHGVNGSGDGVFADQVIHQAGSSNMHIDGHTIKSPSNFTDAATMLGASPALLHGKIVRGGMGTGMPYWGPIFKDEQIWNIISYLWTFQFQYAEVSP